MDSRRSTGRPRMPFFPFLARRESWRVLARTPCPACGDGRWRHAAMAGAPCPRGRFPARSLSAAGCVIADVTGRGAASLGVKPRAACQGRRENGAAAPRARARLETRVKSALGTIFVKPPCGQQESLPARRGGLFPGSRRGLVEICASRIAFLSFSFSFYRARTGFVRRGATARERASFLPREVSASRARMARYSARRRGIQGLSLRKLSGGVR